MFRSQSLYDFAKQNIRHTTAVCLSDEGSMQR